MAKGNHQKLADASALYFMADFILANPPFNMSDWSRGGGMRQDVRRKFGMPPVNNANYAWIQDFIHHLSPVGVAGFVLANSASDALDRMQ